MLREHLLTNESAEAMGRELRALTLHPTWLADGPLDYLAKFTGLRHLDIEVTPGKLESFYLALAQLPLLRSVELRILRLHSEHFSNWDEMVRMFAANRPELQHLGLYGMIKTKRFSKEPLLLLEHLVSIEIHHHDGGTDMDGWKALRELNCGWLEALAERGQLEHVAVSGYKVPLKLLCQLISSCKVRGLEPSCPY